MPDLTASQEIFLATVSHAHYRERYGAHLSNEVLAIIDAVYNDSKRSLTSSIESIRETYDSSDTRGRKALIASINEALDDIYKIRSPAFAEYYEKATSDLVEFSDYEANFASERIMSGSIATALEGTGLAIAVAGVAGSTVYNSAIKTRTSLGNSLNGTLDSFMKNIEPYERSRIFGMIESGLSNGLTNSQIIKTVFDKTSGTAATTVTRRSIDTMVRTAANAVGMAANEETAKANSDLIRGYRNVGVFDNRQSPICKSVSLKFGDKVMPNYEDFPPVPRHPRCRSLIQMVLKSWHEILKSKKVYVEDHGEQSFFAPPAKVNAVQLTAMMKDKGMTDQQIATFKARISGQTSATTLEGFLSEQKSRGNKDFLYSFFDSKERAQYYIDGKATTKELFRENGTPIPLNELRDKNL